ncbi:hypothetical protein [Hyphomonas sp.]|uniref:hypothetical protein n=1 Tax=Hyphomonas sp. TaxID=87 RepID=UPI00352873AD
MEKLFPEIASIEDVMRLTRGGAIAGILFCGLILLDGLLGTSSLARSGLQLAATGIETFLILFLAWRVWSGRSFVSAILLMALLVLSTMTGIHDGAFGLAWMAAYFGLGLMMLNAVRASLRHDIYSEDTSDAQAA